MQRPWGKVRASRKVGRQDHPTPGLGPLLRGLGLQTEEVVGTHQEVSRSESRDRMSLPGVCSAGSGSALPPGYRPAPSPAPTLSGFSRRRWPGRRRRAGPGVGPRRGGAPRRRAGGAGQRRGRAVAACAPAPPGDPKPTNSRRAWDSRSPSFGFRGGCVRFSAEGEGPAA